MHIKIFWHRLEKIAKSALSYFINVYERPAQLSVAIEKWAEIKNKFIGNAAENLARAA
jgi:hypothetical protein